MEPIDDAELEAMVFGGNTANDDDVDALRKQAEILLADVAPVESYEIEYSPGGFAISFRVDQYTDDEDPHTLVSFNINDGESDDEPYLFQAYRLGQEEPVWTTCYAERPTEENGEFAELIVGQLLQEAPDLSPTEKAIFERLLQFAKILQNGETTEESAEFGEGEKIPFPEAILRVVLTEAERKEIVRQASAVIGSHEVSISSCVYDPPPEDSLIAAHWLPCVSIFVTDQTQQTQYFAQFLQDKSITSGVMSAREMADELHYLEPDEETEISEKHSAAVIQRISGALVDFSLQENDLL